MTVFDVKNTDFGNIRRCFEGYWLKIDTFCWVLSGDRRIRDKIASCLSELAAYCEG